ncbi:MAG: ABC transporter permease, partial [Candidatus Delongbacteria bacterium]|nr:ABC transporter permease [Candidatus Delongbacteria bacterium]
MILDFIIGIISAGIPLAAPLLLAGLGEMFNQRAGVFNLGVEGIMLMGAFVGFLVVLTVGSPVLGLLAAILVGAVMGLIMAVVTVKFKAQQGISGIGLFMLGWGLSGTLFRVYVGGITSIKGIKGFSFPLLGKIPIIGEIFFQNNILVYITFLLVPISWYVLNKTAWGLKVRAVGTNPQAADTLGIKVERIRFQCIILGSMMAGLAGAYLTIAQTHIFADNITAGRG